MPKDKSDSNLIDERNPISTGTDRPCCAPKKDSKNQQVASCDLEIDEENGRTNLATLIGEFGNYQLSLSVFSFIRYVCVAMMTNTGPLIAPTLDFRCQPPGSMLNSNHLANLTVRNECFYTTTNGSDSSEQKCLTWNYNTTEYGTTLTDTFNLVCDRDWLRSLFQSTVSVGVVVASILFGSFSDQHGRKATLNICYVISLLAGSFSIYAPTFMSYAISRAICSMSDLGIVGSLYTIIVETLGNKHRGTVCIIVYTGWSVGVMIMPWITGYYNNFRHVMMFTVACHLLTLPWMFTVGESIRWLLINGKVEEAEKEIKRIHGWNSFGRRSDDRKSFARIRISFNQMKLKYIAIAERKRLADKSSTLASNGFMLAIRSLFGGFRKVCQIFRSKELVVTTVTIIWITFNSELMYMLFIMINSDVGDNAKLNYAIGGLMETLATLIAIVLISKFTRRCSLTTTLLIISCSILGLSFTHHHSTLSILVLNFTKLAVSTLSSLIFVVSTELFPTDLRQTGIGLASTLGSCGAVVAPFIRKELTDMIGMTNVLLLLFFFPLSAATLVPFFLRETKDAELPDDIDEITAEEEILDKKEMDEMNSGFYSPKQTTEHLF